MKKIFLGGLPKSVTDEKLKEIFSSYGEIVDFVVMKDPYTKESRGFGFIEFDSEEPVNQILKSRPHVIDNREIEVRRAMPKDITHNTIHERTKRLFIGGLSYEVTDDMLLKYYTEKFSKYGKVESAEVKRERETNSSRGFGFITFDSEDAVDAVLILDPKPALFGRNCEVKKSEPRRQDDSAPRKREKNRRRSPLPPPSRRVPRHGDYYDDYSPPRDSYSRHSRSRSGREPYPPDTYSRTNYEGASYERSPYRGSYRDSPPYQPSGLYRDHTGGYDRPHQYPPYSENQQYYNNARAYPDPYVFNQRNSASHPTVNPVGSTNQTSTNHLRPTNSAPFTPRAASSQYHHFESGYRDREANPY